ncbi:MAG TPA: hypothetical protein VFQ38_18430 [Longimicrobiales bacterium]|nr:hypothetical protein [Longimicrobiales bacterium]
MRRALLAPLRALKTKGSLYADRLRRGGLYHEAPAAVDPERHLREAVLWLERAQDAGADRGVSYGVDFGGAWEASYPETTGYIIPTFLKLADVYRDESLLARAVEMGRWESDVQMECGAVMGGRADTAPTPAVFNTGMVLLGWSALYERTTDPRFLASIRRASDWLLELQEPNGDWRKGNSRFADPNATVYNVKAAWGLAEGGRVAGNERAIEGAVRNAEFCTSRQEPNGWFRDCCLVDASQPLLHTVAYAMQGLLGVGVVAGRQDFVRAARRTADSLLGLMDGEGFIPGRIGPDFRGTVDWCCLTGTAQTAIVWGRLFQLTGERRYHEAMQRATGYLMRRHDVDNPDPRLRGGVPGSWPTWGDYGRLKILNWATNFFVEALVLQREIAGAAGAESGGACEFRDSWRG